MEGNTESGQLDPRDVAALRMFAGAHFGPDATVILPSGRKLDSDEMQALTSFYAEATDTETQRGLIMERLVNGRTLSPLWGWRHGPYLITTDSPQAAASGEGDFVVARGDWGTADPSVVTLTWIGTESSLSDAVALAEYDQRMPR